MGITVRVRDARINKGMSLRHLAEITDINRGHLSKLENGHEMPRVDILVRIAVALDCTLDDLVEY